VQEIVRLADAWNQMNARLKLATAGQREFATAHHSTKAQPFSVGLFHARNASVGAVLRLGLASGIPSKCPIPARFSSLCAPFSLPFSRAFSTPHPALARVCAGRVVTKNCCTGGD
jgi:hypothetical protein